MSAEDKKLFRTLRRLRACARPVDAGATAAQLGEGCKENAVKWTRDLGDADLRDLVPPPAPPPPAPLERIRKEIRRFLRQHADVVAGVGEINGVLQDEHANLDAHNDEEVPPPIADGGLQALRLRVAPRYPGGWGALGEDDPWNPGAWDEEERTAISKALDRREALGARVAPDSADKLWPSLDEETQELPAHTQVQPACGKYKKEDVCVWPCAWKKGNKDKTSLCRPARRAF